MEYSIRNLEDYKPKNPERIESREVLKNAKIFFRGGNLIVHAFEENIFPEEPCEEQTEEEKGEEYILPKDKLEIIAEKENSIKNELFENYFKYQSPSYMYESLNNTKKTERNKIRVNLIKSALTDLKNRINNISEDEKRIEQPGKIVDIVEKILVFNERYQEG